MIAGLLVSWLVRSAAAEELLAQTAGGVARISKIVDAMRSYTHLDQAPVQNVDVREGLENTILLLGGTSGAIDVKREYAPELPPVWANGSELNQVWTNIIQNAAEALQGTGSLTIRAARSDGEVVVDIEDDGPGMSPEVTARAFDPFFTTKPPGKGTGLGLAILGAHRWLCERRRRGVQEEDRHDGVAGVALSPLVSRDGSQGAEVGTRGGRAVPLTRSLPGKPAYYRCRIRPSWILRPTRRWK
jgi:light-regulated signal transduction histidine kinase (bacteriophytochrome)